MKNNDYLSPLLLISLLWISVLSVGMLSASMLDGDYFILRLVIIWPFTFAGIQSTRIIWNKFNN